jgi:hypothetical protein
VVTFENELEGVPQKLADVKMLTDALARAVEKSKVEGAEAILPGARFSFNLDFRDLLHSLPSAQTSSHEIAEVFDEKDAQRTVRVVKKHNYDGTVKGCRKCGLVMARPGHKCAKRK